jgi:hypothetical protein
MPWLVAVAVAVGGTSSGAFAAPVQPAAANSPASDGPPPPPPPGAMKPPPPPPGAMKPPPPAKPKVGPPGVAAIVNGQQIKIDEVKTMAYQHYGSPMLTQLIQSTLVDQEARKLNLSASPAEIQAKIAEVKTQIESRGPGQTLESALKTAHMTMADLRSLYRTRVLIEKLADRRVKPTKMLHLRHILIMTANPAGSPDVKPHTEDEAKAIFQKVQDDIKAGKSWDELVTTYSEDKQTNSKEKAGDLGVVGPNTGFDQDFMKGANALKTGEISKEPIKSVYGIHIVKLESTSSDAKGAEKDLYKIPMDQDRQQQQGMMQQTILKELQDKAKIDNFIDQ